MDQLQNKNILSEAQETEAILALTMFEQFQHGILIASKVASRSLVNTSLINLSKLYEINFFVSEIDFDDPESIKKFIDYWRADENTLDNLHEGYFDPKHMIGESCPSYPVFLFVNPTNLNFLSENYLSKDDCVFAMEAVKKIAKFGRVHLVVTPDRLENTGTLWPKIPLAYQNSLSDPRNVSSKFELAKYFFTREGLKQIGLSDRTETPDIIYTPREEAIEKVLKH